MLQNAKTYKGLRAVLRSKKASKLSLSLQSIEMLYLNCILPLKENIILNFTGKYSIFDSLNQSIKLV